MGVTRDRGPIKATNALWAWWTPMHWENYGYNQYLQDHELFALRV